MSTRPSVAPGPTPAERSAFAEDVERSLTLAPRQLPSRYLYDALGSALFEAICRLPWYKITRTEQRMLSSHGRALFRTMPPITDVVELGPGNGRKLAALLRSAESRRPRAAHLVDVSSAALSAATREVGAVPGVIVVTYETEYDAGLSEACARRSGAGRMMVLCLGSNIGNFDPSEAEAFLRRVRGLLRTGDALLLGTDLVKPAAELLLAYDDPLGVTAAFNRNLLVRANRELGATFDVAAFAHRAVWNESAARVEMHLVCRRPHVVRVPASRLEIAFGLDEPIWTESSYKYVPDQVTAMLGEAAFETVRQWTEDGFALTLARAAPWLAPGGAHD